MESLGGFTQLLLGIGATGALLVIVFLLVRAFLFAQSSYAQELRSRIKGLDHYVLVPPPRSEIARARADERRRRIQIAFRELEIPTTKSGSTGSRILPREFIEAAPGSEIESTVFSREDRSLALSQMARLYWQLERPELLLGERVVDWVVQSLGRQNGQEETESKPYPLVRLVYREDWVASDLFPWLAIVETTSQRIISSLLEVKDWLGIAIAIGSPSSFFRYGQCAVGGGLEGVVGGTLNGAGESFGVTCAHVLARDCGSLILTSDTQAEETPDVALIHPETPCFDVPSPELRPCQAASDDTVRTAIMRRATVRKRHPHLRKNAGFVNGRVLSFPLGGLYSRFPHLQVLPKTGVLTLFLRPLIQAIFSRPGDSGAWVFDEDSGHWLGMVVGGDSDFMLSYAAEAAPLLYYLHASLIDQGLINDTEHLEAQSYGGREWKRR